MVQAIFESYLVSYETMNKYCNKLATLAFFSNATFSVEITGISWNTRDLC